MAVPGNGITGVAGDCLIGTDQVREVKKWSFKPKMDNKEYSSNITAGAKKRVSSVKDGSGTIDGVWDPWNPITDVMEVGDTVTLKLQHKTLSVWTVPAIIDDMSFDVDIESGEVQGWTANFSTNGAWTNPSPLAATTTAALLGPRQFERAEPLGEESPTMQEAKTEQAPSAMAHRPNLSSDDVQSIAERVAAILGGRSQEAA